MTNWHAVYCEPQRDLLAAKELQRRGFEVFCPFEVVKVQRRQGHARFKMVEVTRSVFSPYLFIRTDRFLAALQVPGLLTFVGVQGDPLPIPGKVIDTLKKLVDGDGRLVRSGKLASTWFTGAVGSEFDFNHTSPLRGMLGRISALSDLDERGEIKAFVKMLGGEREVVVPISAVGTVYDRPTQPQHQAAA